MTWRVVPRSALPLILRFYGVAVGAGSLFAGIIFYFGQQREGESMAALFATLWITLGALWIGYLYAQALSAGGVARWKVNIFLVAITLAPGTLLYLSPLWGSLVFAVSIPVALCFCVAPGGE